MPTDVVMPQMGESIVEGAITKWLKNAGDAVRKDEPLFEISTDKVDAEIPAPVAGVLAEIKVPEGVTVQINTVVAVIAEAGETAQPAAPPEPQEQSAGTVVVMPQMGESIVEGTITRWLKKVGEPIRKDEPLFEISTDKVDAEIPAPIEGIVSQILVAEGATVQINTPVAVIGGDAAAAPAPAVPATAPKAAAAPKEIAATAPAVPLPLAPIAGRRLRSSPLVRRIARENNVDLTRVPGTGSDGRINKQDILAYLAAYGPGGAPAQPRAAAAQGELQVPGDLVPMSRMRAIIAQRMVESKRISPHVYSVYKVDMTRIVRLREREKAGYEKRNGIRLTFMPFIAAAAVEAMRQFPIVNASLEGESIRYHRSVNLGIAVALEWGLIVPVVRQAEQRSFPEMARMIADLAERARTKKLNPEEASGSTFTLTNAGVFGGEFGTPILNQPESAILAIGGLRKEPVVLTDAEGNDTIAIRSMQQYCLGFDHRLIDGADAGKFMTAFKDTLENWNRAIG